MQGIPQQAIFKNILFSDLLRKDEKPIKKLRVLCLTDNLASWLNDSINCLRLYYRLINTKLILNNQTLKLFSKWATLLIYYSKIYGLEERPQILNTDIYISHPYILKELKKVASIQNINKFLELNLPEFQILISNLNKIDHKNVAINSNIHCNIILRADLYPNLIYNNYKYNKLCPITKIELFNIKDIKNKKQVCNWKINLYKANNPNHILYEIICSEFTNINLISHLHNLIKSGLNRHKSKQLRQGYVNKIYSRRKNAETSLRRKA